MTAYITIPVATANNVVRVANGALRYKPDVSAEQIRALYQKYGLTRQAASGGAPAASGKQVRNHGEGTPGGGPGAAGAGQHHAARADGAEVRKLRTDKPVEPVRMRTGSRA